VAYQWEKSKMGSDGGKISAWISTDGERSTSSQHSQHRPEVGPNPEAVKAIAETSNHRAETSRRNGSKSRGPKTTEGKNRSRLNALKHGLRAEALFLEIGSEEENAAFCSLRDRLEEQFPASTVEEQLLLESVVLALWQKKRGLQFEARELRQELVFHGPVMDRILRYGTAADNRLFRALAQLKRLREENPSALTDDDVAQE
jgi:hypothetical protein